MKSIMHFLMIALLAVSIQGCGKKDKKASSNTKPSTPPVVAETATETLIKAVLNNDLEAAQKAIKDGANVDFKLNTGDTLLTHTIKNALSNQVEMVTLLLESGANTEKKDQDNLSPLMLAVKNEKEKIVNLLIAYKAQIDETDADGNTVLMTSIQLKNESIARILITAGANLYLRNSSGQSALDLARTNNLSTLADYIATTIQVDQNVPNFSTLLNVITRGDLDALKKLIEKYPELLKGDESPSPIIAAMRFVEETPNLGLQMVELLVNGGAPVDGSSTDDKRSPLIEAAATDSPEYLNLLLTKGANINRRDETGWNSLLHSIEVNNVEMVDQLLGKKAEKKYTHKLKNGQKIRFSACAFANKVQKRVKKEPEEKAKNKEIRKLLKCGFFIFTN